MTITYNGSTWDAQAYDNATPIGTTTFVEGDFSGIADADKKLGAVHFPIAVTPKWNQNNGLSFGDDTYFYCHHFYCHHLYQSEAAYTVDGANVNITLSLQKKDNVVLFHIPGIQANASAYTLKITGEGVTNAIPCFNAINQNGQVESYSQTGTYLFNRGIADTDGGYFAVSTNPGSEKTYTFTVTGPDQSYTKTVTKTLQSGYQYNLKALSDASWKPKFHEFSVSSVQKVHIAPSNLVAHYTGPTNSKWSWRFATNQYDYVGEGGQNKYIATSTKESSEPYARTTGDNSGNVDLFGWSTAATYFGIAISNEASEYSGEFVDWGSNVIENYAANTWRTLTMNEWQYLFNTRAASTIKSTANARYAKAKVNNIKGIILFPDTYTHPSDVTYPASINTANAYFSVNNYDATAWEKMEAAGCVFLPAAGLREVATVSFAGEYGYYWSSSKVTSEAKKAKRVIFTDSYACPPDNTDTYRKCGYSVRLVRNVN